MKKLSLCSVLFFLIISFVFVLGGSRPAFAATSPSLDAAETFSVLSGTGATNTGITSISGDLGVSPAASYTDAGTTTFLTPGNPHLADAAAAAAQVSNSAAFDALDAGDNADANCIGGILPSGTDLTTLSPLAPGLYCSAGTFLLTGNLELTGTTGTWVFKTVSGLITSPGSSVTGGDPCNIWWRVGSSATLATTTDFRGNILALTSVGLDTGANLDGRAFAYNGATTLNTNTISGPACTAVAPPSGGMRREGTINVVKTVINDNGGTMITSDFPLFINGIPVLSGVTNTFSANTPYTVTETTNPQYARTFSGDCDVNGDISLFTGGNKFCIVTNDDIGPPLLEPPLPPLISVVKVPSPLALPNGPGLVEYTYTVRNMGTVSMTNVTMVGDSCTPIVLNSGDTNDDDILTVSETWVYTCSTTLTETHTNTVVATGWSKGVSSVDIATATVVVGEPIVPPLIHVTKIPRPRRLLSPGRMVTYIERISNPGTVPLSNVQLTDNTCSPMRYISGDRNQNALLDTNETWTYACRARLTKTTTNTAIASGDANGITVRDFAVATVVVGARVVTPPPPVLRPSSPTVIPILPRTGFEPVPGNEK